MGKKGDSDDELKNRVWYRIKSLMATGGLRETIAGLRKTSIVRQGHGPFRNTFGGIDVGFYGACEGLPGEVV